MPPKAGNWNFSIAIPSGTVASYDCGIIKVYYTLKVPLSQQLRVWNKRYQHATFPFQLEAAQKGLMIFDQNIDLGVEIPVKVYVAKDSATTSNDGSDPDTVASEYNHETPVQSQPTATVIREYTRDRL